MLRAAKVSSSVFDKSVLPWHFMPQQVRTLRFSRHFNDALGVFIVVLLEKIATRLKTKI